MPGRQFNTGVGYRYGFNGKENDNEVKGLGNQQDYGLRIYDPRLGRFLSVDPLTKSFPWYTPYQFAGNMPIWAIDLDGSEEMKTTDFKFQEVASYNITKLISEETIKNKIADQIYAALDKQIPSKTERITNSNFQTSARYKGEADIIKDELKKYIVIDLENQYSAVFDPESNEPQLIFKFGKALFEFANEEAQPVMAKAAGTASYNVGNAIVKVSENVESYKTKFYKKYFPNKYGSASKINTGTNKLLGKALKGTGTLLKASAKTLDVFGTIGMFYEVLNPSSGPMTDDQLRSFTTNALKKYLTQQSSNNDNSTNSSAGIDIPDNQSASNEKKGK